MKIAITSRLLHNVKWERINEEKCKINFIAAFIWRREKKKLSKKWGELHQSHANIDLFVFMTAIHFPCSTVNEWSFYFYLFEIETQKVDWDNQNDELKFGSPTIPS